MAKPAITDEVQVLRFFETGPIEKAEAVFNIISEKMRERLRGANQDHDRPTPLRSPRKRGASENQKTQNLESAEPANQM